jgi:ferric-dicitrate binding protein FerR (iron transport regulator)
VGRQGRPRSGNSAVGRHLRLQQGNSFGSFALNRTPEPSETQGQAATWLVRLDAGSSAATLAQWRQWLSEDARHRTAYLRLESSWRHADCLKNLQPLDGTVNPGVLETFPGICTFPKKRPPASRAEVAYRTLAAALALITLMLAAWLCIAKSNRGVHRTELGWFERVVLPDGATIDAGSPPDDPGGEAIRRLGPEPQFAPH